MNTSSPHVRTARRMRMEDTVIVPIRQDPAFRSIRDMSTMLVPGVGNLEAEVAVVGESPGETEDRTGVPFIGPAGVLLDWFLGLADLSRDSLWITNLVKYRCQTEDGRNRRPTSQEAYSARAYLKRELSIISPRLVVLCGRSAYQAVCPGRSVVADHGRMFTGKAGRTYFVVLHPSACLQRPTDDWKEETALDFVSLGEHLAELRAA